MSGTDSPHGFTTTGRGERGYRPAQVERYLSELSTARDAAWERAARLTVLANEMAAEAERLREVVAQLPPQTYAELGEGAQLILATAEREAERLRTDAEQAGQQATDAAAEYADATRDAAATAAAELRADADDWAERRLEQAEAAAVELRAEAEADAERWRREAVDELQLARERTRTLGEEQSQQHADRWEALGVEIAEREAALESRIAELAALGERTVAESQRAYATVEEAARHGQEDAEAQGEELVARARARAERVERETEQVLRLHAAEREELTEHMEHVRESLGALTGRRVPADRRPDQAATPSNGAEAAPLADPAQAPGGTDADHDPQAHGPKAADAAPGPADEPAPAHAAPGADRAGAAPGATGPAATEPAATEPAESAGRAVPRPAGGPPPRKLGDEDDTIEVELPVPPVEHRTP
ncbi:cellulose-binding protein [Streptomyces sp. NPDC057702]|uniref:cellulose-binding protein n=1 Tax=unclassified Streptomyces TaxID=2593676 RepID=UPI0036804C29